jgi:hypothetical protein
VESDPWGQAALNFGIFLEIEMNLSIVGAVASLVLSTAVEAVPLHIVNGGFYEGVCQAPLEFRCSVVHWRLLLVRLS